MMLLNYATFLKSLRLSNWNNSILTSLQALHKYEKDSAESIGFAENRWEWTGGPTNKNFIPCYLSYINFRIEMSGIEQTGQLSIRKIINPKIYNSVLLDAVIHNKHLHNWYKDQVEWNLAIKVALFLFLSACSLVLSNTRVDLVDVPFLIDKFSQAKVLPGAFACITLIMVGEQLSWFLHTHHRTFSSWDGGGHL